MSARKSYARDSEPGLRRVTYPSGREAWVHRYYIARKQIERVLDVESVEEARLLVRAGAAALKAGKDPKVAAVQAAKVEVQKTTTFGDCFGDWLDDGVLKTKSKHYQKQVRYAYHALSVLHEVPMAQFHFSDLADALKAYMATPAKAHMCYAMARRVCGRALFAKLIQHHPLLGVDLTDLSWMGSKPRGDSLTVDELRWLWRTMKHDAVGDAIRVLILTGCRPSEPLQLTAADIESDRYTLKRTKAGKPRVMPMTPAVRLLLRRHAACGGRLFPFPRETMYARLRRAQNACGKRHFSLHEIRATVNTTIRDEDLATADDARLALGHQPKDVNEAHYQRGPMLKSKGRVLLAWEGFLREADILPPIAALAGAMQHSPVRVYGRFGKQRTPTDRLHG